MKNISLLPPEILKEKKSQKQQRLIMVACLGALAGLILVFALIMVITSLERSRLAGLEEESQTLQQQVSDMEHYADMQDRAEEAEELLREALGEGPYWDILMESISTSMPGGIWLEDLSASFGEEDEDGEITLRGRSLHHDAVALWLQRLQNLDDLENISCQYVELDGGGEQQAVQFEINGDLKSGQPFERMLYDVEEGGLGDEL